MNEPQDGDVVLGGANLHGMAVLGMSHYEIIFDIFDKKAKQYSKWNSLVISEDVKLSRARSASYYDPLKVMVERKLGTYTYPHQRWCFGGYLVYGGALFGGAAYQPMEANVCVTSVAYKALSRLAFSGR